MTLNENSKKYRTTFGKYSNNTPLKKTELNSVSGVVNRTPFELFSDQTACSVCAAVCSVHLAFTVTKNDPFTNPSWTFLVYIAFKVRFLSEQCSWSGKLFVDFVFYELPFVILGYFCPFCIVFTFLLTKGRYFIE